MQVKPALETYEEQIMNSYFYKSILAFLIMETGVAGITDRIIGGEVVPDSTYYPWMVAIVNSADSSAVDGLICGGMLLAPDIVLTAGHCVASVDAVMDTGSVNIISGSVDLDQTDFTEIIRVESTLKYPGYQEGWLAQNTYQGGDFGVLILEDSTQFVSSYLSVIESEEDFSPGDSVTVVGWSYSYPDTLSSELKHVGFPLQPLDTCKTYFGTPELLNDDVHICAGNSVAGPCFGDSGGPLIFESSGETYLGGVVSSGTNMSCSGEHPENYYGIFVNVFEFRGWINAIINGNSFHDMTFSNKDNFNNLLTGTLRADSFHPFIESGDTLPLPIGASVTVSTHSQFLVDGALQHHHWGTDNYEFRLEHDFIVYQFTTGKTAKFEPLDSVRIVNEHDARIQIKDPWFVENGEQNNEFHVLADSTNSLFLNQDPDDEMYYVLKTTETIGIDSLWFDKWMAYDSQYNEDTSEIWAELASPQSPDSCMVIFKQEHAIVRAMYSDVSGAPATPPGFTVDCSGDYPALSWNPNMEKDLFNYRVYYRYCCNPSWTDWFHASTTDTFWADENFDLGSGSNKAQFKISAMDVFNNEGYATSTKQCSGDVGMWPARETDEIQDLPDNFSLQAPYPNPFNPAVSITIAVPEFTSNASLIVYDIKGRQVAVLTSGRVNAGYHTFTWDGSQYPAGLYLVKFTAGDYTDTLKIILLK